MTEEKELQPVDIEWEAEKICRWGAARAGVIVVAPLVGTMALMANEVYMIMRLGELRGVKLEESAVLGLLTSLGATFVGQTTGNVDSNSADPGAGRCIGDLCCRQGR